MWQLSAMSKSTFSLARRSQESYLLHTFKMVLSACVVNRTKHWQHAGNETKKQTKQNVSVESVKRARKRYRGTDSPRSSHLLPSLSRTSTAAPRPKSHFTWSKFPSRAAACRAYSRRGPRGWFTFCMLKARLRSQRK